MPHTSKLEVIVLGKVSDDSGLTTLRMCSGFVQERIASKAKEIP